MEVDEEYTKIMKKINSNLIEQCNESKIDFNQIWKEIKNTIDWNKIKNEFVGILHLKDDKAKNIELIKYEVNLTDTLFEYISTSIEAFKPIEV